jgi:hypothetical protein
MLKVGSAQKHQLCAESLKAGLRLRTRRCLCGTLPLRGASNNTQSMITVACFRSKGLTPILHVFLSRSLANTAFFSDWNFAGR